MSIHEIRRLAVHALRPPCRAELPRCAECGRHIEGDLLEVEGAHRTAGPERVYIHRDCLSDYSHRERFAYRREAMERTFDELSYDDECAIVNAREVARA